MKLWNLAFLSIGLSMFLSTNACMDEEAQSSNLAKEAQSSNLAEEAQGFNLAGVAIPEPIFTRLSNNMCVDVQSGMSINGTPVQLYSCNGSPAQAWTFNNGSLKVLANKCLDVPSGYNVNGTKLQIWDCVDGSPNQKWKIVGSQLIWIAGNKCLDLSEGNLNNGTKLQIWDCFDGNRNQQWTASFFPIMQPVYSATIRTGPQFGSGTYKTLTWSDEFNGTNLNSGNWTFEVDCNGGYNGEEQCYTNSSKNLTLNGNGIMSINLIKSNTVLANGKTFTSARINSQNKRDFTYGRMEARLKIPSGKGLWPAFWMMPTQNTYGNWPSSGELDIMEILGDNPQRTFSTLHFGKPSPYTQLQGIFNSVDLSKDFHVYAVERDPQEIRWYLDDVKVFTARDTDTNFWINTNPPQDGTKWPFTKPFFFILNLAVGGWAGSPDPSILESKFEVDYVRVYQ